MKYSTIEISPLELNLDYINPRFIIPPNSSEDKIIEYLLEFEEIVELANGINELESLMFGERPIVCIENNNYIVLEGNRRVCACKLLLNNELIPSKFKNKIDAIKNDTKKNIERIEVDVVETREIAQSSLAAKHIEGAKKWSTFSKNKFFTNEFDAGRTIDYISKITSVSKAKITTGIIQHKLLNYAFDLDIWSKEEKEKYLNPQKIKPSPYFRVFSTKSKVFNSVSAREIIKLDYDPVTYEPVSSLPKEVFNNSIYLIAKAAFVNDDFNTRNIIDDVPGFVDYMSSFYSKSVLKPNEKYLPEDNETDIPENNQGDIIDSEKDRQKEKQDINRGKKVDVDIEPKIDSEKDNKDTEDFEPLSKDNDNVKSPESLSKDNDKNLKPKEKNNNEDLKAARPALGNFFENLTWATVDPSNNNNTGLINIANEIVAISKNNIYKKFPISATILMRALLENTMIYHLKKLGLYEKFSKGYNGKTPPLEKIIDYYKRARTSIFSGDANFERTFTSFTESSGTKDYLDMVIHNPHLVQAVPSILDNIAQCGLKGFIQTILNE